MKLLEYWIPQIQETKEFEQIANAEQPDVDLLHQKINDFPNEIIVNTSTNAGLKKWEKVLDIPTTHQLDVRRFNVL